MVKLLQNSHHINVRVASQLLIHTCWYGNPFTVIFTWRWPKGGPKYIIRKNL